MGEHNVNEKVLLDKTLPSFPPSGRAFALKFGLQVHPKENIFLVSQENVRDVDGKRQVKVEEEWKDVPEGKRVHVLGEPLASSDCAVSLVLICQYANTTIAAREPLVGAHVMPVEFGRFDYEDMVKVCEQSLPGRGLVVM